MERIKKMYLILSCLVLFSCNNLYQGLYYHSSPFGGEFVKINSDSTFLYYSTMPQKSDLFGEGSYYKKKNKVYLNSTLKEIPEFIRVNEINKSYDFFSDTCYSIFLTCKFERSYYNAPTQIRIKTISSGDTLTFLPYSDSIQIMNCNYDSIWSSFYKNTWIYHDPSLKGIKKILIEFDEKQFAYQIQDIKRILEIQIYDKNYDTLEYRVFKNERWKLARKRLIELNTQQNFQLLNAKDNKDAELLSLYDYYIDLISKNN